MTQSFLLDTHTILWFLSGNSQLSDKLKKLILNVMNDCYISIASLWEIAIKLKLGKLKLDLDFKALANYLAENNIQILYITFDHLIELIDLEFVHRDPFDRLIISQSIVENIPIITKDKNIPKYRNLKVIW